MAALSHAIKKTSYDTTPYLLFHYIFSPAFKFPLFLPFIFAGVDYIARNNQIQLSSPNFFFKKAFYRARPIRFRARGIHVPNEKIVYGELQNGHKNENYQGR
jgi:hypothetical protein